MGGVCVVLMQIYTADTTIKNRIKIGRPFTVFSLIIIIFSALKFPHSWGSIRVWTTPECSCAADVIEVQAEGGWNNVKAVTEKIRLVAKNHSLEVWNVNKY